MGWADAPLVDDTQSAPPSAAQPAWASAPLADEPDQAQANHTFAQTVGNAIQRYAPAIKQRVTDAASEEVSMAEEYGKNLISGIEASLNFGSGFFLGGAARLGGSAGGLLNKYGLPNMVDPIVGLPSKVVTTLSPWITRNILGHDPDPAELADTLSELATYSPRTKKGKEWAETLGYPLEKLSEYGSEAGHKVTDVAMQAGIPDSASAAAGAITEQTLNVLPYILLGEMGKRLGGQKITNDDFKNTSQIIADHDPKTAQTVEQSLRTTYEKTGIGPYSVMEDAAKNPEIKEDLVDHGVDLPAAYKEFAEELPKPVPENELGEPSAHDNGPLLDVSGPTVEEEKQGINPEENFPSINDDGTVNLHAGISPVEAFKAIRDDYTPFVGVESPNASKPSIATEGQEASPFVDAIQKIFAPATRGDIAQQQASIIRANLGEEARQREIALEKMKSFAADFDKLPVEDNLKFIDAMERGTKLDDPKQAQAALALRNLLDQKREEVQALGKGQLENFDENYFPHMWKDEKGAEALFSRRPLAGSAGFLKQRTIPFTTDGMRWRAYDSDGDFIKSYDTEADAKSASESAGGRASAPLTPITTNPVEMALLKTREMDKYIYGQKIFEEMKNADLARFVRFGERALPGWTKIDDKIARVWSPADVDIHEAYDAQMMSKLRAFADDIGVKVSRGVKIGGGSGASESRTWGWASRTGQVATKFGGPETVLTHELGHQLDYKYGLEDQFINDPATKKELRSLADLRYEGQDDVPESFKKYVRKGTEKISNMVHAYVHMPDRFQEVAPNTFAKFEQFLDAHPELSGLREIKPSLTLGSNSATVNAGGMILRGEYYAPDEAATLINNHLSPGLQGNGFYDAWRGVGMAMNSLQLGLSAFHVGFTTMDSMISKVALGVKQISRGDIFEGATNVAQGINPAQPFINLYKGDRLLRAYLGKLDDPDIAPIADALMQAGGRVKMDDFYRNAAVNAFKQALRRDDYLEAGKLLLPTILDRVSAPIFEDLVPRQKLGVFFDMAKDYLENNPDADMDAKRTELGKMWDSVDNRMGQLVYDNVFWNRALKDGLMASVRSVGWNLGTFRELGGGIADIGDILKNKGFTDRTAYIVALPLLAGVYGAMTNYLYTGEPPRDLKDCFYPRTGRTRPDGSEDRVSLPTYMKDVFAYGEDIKNAAEYGGDPTQTLKNKAHPLIATISQMLNNQDFFGAAIRNPADPAVKQVLDVAEYLIHQFEPFSLRNYQQQTKLKNEPPSLEGYIESPSMIGITPAPGYMTKSQEELESSQVSRMHDPLMNKFKEELKNGADLDELMPEMLNSGLSKRDIKYLIQSSGDTPKPHRLKKFGSDDDAEDANSEE